FADRILVIRIRIDFLSGGRYEVFQEQNRVILVGRILGQRGAGGIDVRAPTGARTMGTDDFDRVAPGSPVGSGLVVLNRADSIGVGDSYIAYAADDIARAVPIATRRLARQVLLYAFTPYLRGFHTVMGDLRGDQRCVVRMLPRSDADLAFP